MTFVRISWINNNCFAMSLVLDRCLQGVLSLCGYHKICIYIARIQVKVTSDHVWHWTSSLFTVLHLCEIVTLDHIFIIPAKHIRFFETHSISVRSPSNGALHYVKSFFVKSGLSHLRQINSIHFRFRRVTCFPKMNSKENMDEKAVHMNAACVRHDGLCKLLSNWRFQAWNNIYW